jgi:hypothetical protein
MRWRAIRWWVYLGASGGAILISAVAFAQFATPPTYSAGTVGAACTSSSVNYAWPDTSGHVLQCVSNVWTLVGQPASAAGSNGQVQFNNSGILGASSNLFWDNTNNRLGIGTAVPSQSLDAYISSGAAGLPAAIGSAQDGIARLRSAANSSVDIGVNGASPYQGWIQVTNPNTLGTDYSLLLNPNGGDVGIGTTVPMAGLDILTAASVVPLKMKVNDTSTDAIQVFNSANQNVLEVQQQASAETKLLLGAASGGTPVFSSAGVLSTSAFRASFMISTGPTAGVFGMQGNFGSRYLDIFAGSNAVISVDGSNYGLSIGTDYTNAVMPINGLAVQGAVGIGTTAPTSLFYTNDSAAKTANYTGVLHNVIDTSSTASVNKVGMDIESTGTWNGTSAVNTGLIVNAAGGTTNYAATFNGGNVGIGTSTPGAQVEVDIGTAATEGLLIKGAASQSAYLFEARNSSGVSEASLDASGAMSVINSDLTKITARPFLQRQTDFFVSLTTPEAPS